MAGCGVHCLEVIDGDDAVFGVAPADIDCGVDIVQTSFSHIDRRFLGSDLPKTDANTHQLVAADNRFARFDSTTGKVIQSSSASLDDNGFPTWGIGHAGGWAEVTGGAGKTSASSHYIYGGDNDSEPSWLGLQQGDASGKQEAFVQPCVDGVDGRMCLSATAPTSDSNDWIVTQGNNSCVDSVGTDSYGCSVSPSIGAYADGHAYKAKVGTANTGAATLALNGLSALAIKKLNDQDLATGDIEAGQWIEVQHDGTDFQLQSQLASISIVGSKSFLLPDPATGDAGKLQFELPNAATITEISCNVDTATSVTINFAERARATPNAGTTEMLTADLVCDTNGEATTSFTDAALAADVPMTLMIDAASGSPTWLRVHVQYTVTY